MTDHGEPVDLRLSFDETPESYDRTRPVLPEVMFDDMVDAAGLAVGSRIVEIGCGTGQATLPLAQRGLRITAVEIGPQLAAYARVKLAGFPSVNVIASSFEGWGDDGETFDAVLAVNSLHWIDPDVRYTKPAKVLRDDGAMIVGSCRWAAPEQPDPFLAAVQEDYRAVGYPGDPPPAADLIQAWTFPSDGTELFTETTARRYEFTATLSADEYVANLATQSATRGLGAEGAEEFLTRVSHRLASMGQREVTRNLVGLLTVGRRRA